MDGSDAAILAALVDHSQDQLVYLDRELQRVRDTGEAAVWREKPFVFPDQPERGTTYWDWTLAPVKDASGRVTGLVFSLREVTDKVLARQRVETSEQALREANRNKDGFLAALSHELRSPLAAMANALSVLEQGAPGRDHSRAALEIVQRQVAQIARLVDDLLDVARIARGKMRVDRRRVELSELVSRTAEDYRSLFVRAGIILDVRPASEALYVDADPHRMVQVVGNLLQNAARFGRPGGTAWVSVSPAAADHALVRVADDGIGIAPEMLPHLFQPFTQGEAAPLGLGLGLALAKGIVELHGGELRAHSDGRAKGARFDVILPTSAPA